MSVVLVPLDGSAQALVAVPVAQTLASLLHRELHFVHVTGALPAPERLLERLGIDGDTLRGSLVHLRQGDPAVEISALAQESEAMVVLCSRTDGPLAEVALGPIARDVLNQTGAPVVFVRPEREVTPWHIERMLLPYNGTPTTAAAVGPAAELARAAGAELRVLHVATACDLSPEPGTLTGPHYLDQPQHEWPMWAEEFVHRLGCVCRLDDLRVRLVLQRGDPTEETLRASADVDLVVLAWRGRLDVDRAPIVKGALARSPCPVLVVRTP